MPVTMSQPIAGVSASRETEIDVLYPSVAAGGLGRLIGMIMGLAASVPTTPLRILAFLILGSLVFPLGLLAYAVHKLTGKCYVLTNRSLYARSIVGGRLSERVALADIDHITVSHQGGYDFHRVGDLNLENAQGNVLMTVPAVPYPARFRQVILDARNARRESDQSLAHIQARGK